MLKGIVKTQLLFGTDLTQDISVKKDIQKVNTITFWICILLLTLSRNSSGMIGIFVFLLNHVLFRILKQIKTYIIVFSLTLTLIICYSLITGIYRGTCFSLVGIGILILINTSSLKLGSILALSIMLVEFFVCKFHTHFLWIYTYSGEMEGLFNSFIITHLGIYFFTFYCVLKRKELVQYLKDETVSIYGVFKCIAHDIKEPLKSIKKNINKCLYGGIDRASSEHLVTSLNSIESNILGLNGIQRSQKSFLKYNNKTITNISKLTERICSSYRYYALIKKIKFDTEIERALFVRIDNVSFAEILNNLIDNAIKSIGTNGVITVTVKAVDSTVYIYVKDTGKGIPKSEHKKLFEINTQIDKNSKTSNGIGLAFSRTICNVWNGKMDFISGQGKGTCFRLEFPALKGTDNNAASENEGLNRKHATIMIAIGDIECKTMLIRLFIDKYNLFVVESLFEAMEKLYSEESIDLVITDTNIAEKNSKEFIVRLGANKSRPSLPVIILLENSNEKEIIEYLSYGVVDYVVKPFIAKELFLKVESVLSLFKLKEDRILEDISYQISKILSGKYNSDSSIRRDISYQKLVEYRISEKEQRVIEQVAKGLSYKDIASMESISENTVKSYVSRVYKKCNINNKASLLKIFYS